MAALIKTEREDASNKQGVQMMKKGALTRAPVLHCAAIGT